jgi:hypothetical protein
MGDRRGDSLNLAESVLHSTGDDAADERGTRERALREITATAGRRRSTALAGAENTGAEKASARADRVPSKFHLRRRRSDAHRSEIAIPIERLLSVARRFKGASASLMILPQVHLRKPCYDFYFL